MRRFNSATRTMKNSSRFELKMERNFTRSSRGTFGSCASSSTRWLNSSHDKSRLTNASGPISPSTVERFVEEKPVPHPSRAHHEGQVPAEDHGLFDDHGSREDDVHALRLEPADLPALALRETFQSLADRRDVGLPHLQAVAVLALPSMRPEMDAGQRAHRAPQPHHHLSAARGRHGALEISPNPHAEGLELSRPRSLLAEELTCGPHRSQGQTRGGDDLAIPDAAELEARPTEIRHHAVLERQAVERGIGAEPRLVPHAEDPHLDTLLAAKRREEPLPVAGFTHGGCRYRDDPRAPRISGVPREELVYGLERLVDRFPRQDTGSSAPEPRGHALLHQHLVAGIRDDPREQEADSRRAEIDDGYELCHPAGILS